MFDKKILCLGANTEATDFFVSELASRDQTINHGLISDKNFVPDVNGYYHTSVLDLPEGRIRNLAEYFDLVILLDQPQKEYPHFKTFLKTFRLFKDLDSLGYKTQYLDNENCKKAEYWWNLLRTNNSFCYSPFLALIPDIEHTTICGKSKVHITLPTKIVDWKSDPNYRVLRDKMLAGERLDEKYCKLCYRQEELGIESARQFETLEWAVRLEAESIDDINNVSGPVLYEIRPSNKCNIMCRMCDDAKSHLIEKEYIKLNIPLTSWRFKDLPFDQINLDSVQRIYVGGGEPTVMPEFYTFLQKCIDHKRTDFDLCIGTNGMKFSNKLIDLLSNFSKVLLSVSFDGYGKINDYIRWKSEFNTIVRNSKLMQSLGHKIGLQTVISMYNVTRIHEIFEFYDQEFPSCAALVQDADGFGDVLYPWNHPRVDLVLESMDRCKKTDQYLIAGRSVKSYVDRIYAHYSNDQYKVDLGLLRGFFQYNDRLDVSRNSKLGDYVPELEECRKLI